MNRVANDKEAKSEVELSQNAMRQLWMAPTDWSGVAEFRGPTRAERRRRRIRREYNRNYMRLRRGHAKNKRSKRRSRRGTNPREKHGRFRGKEQPRKKNGHAMCAMCGRQPAVCEVTRLRITGKTASGFRAIRVPYCGDC